MKARPRSSAFTMLELVVVIGAVLIVLSIALSTIKKSRQASWEAVCRSNLRQLGALTSLYAQDFADRAPVTEMQSKHPPSSREWRLWAIRLLYATMDSEPWLDFANLERHSPILRCPANRDDRLLDEWAVPDGDLDYVMAASLYVDPSYFDPGLPEQTWRARSGFGPPPMSLAAFPAQKGQQFEHEVWHSWGREIRPPDDTLGRLEYYGAVRPGSVLFMDGHVDLVAVRDAVAPVDRYPIWPIHPFGTTPGGILGRDLK